MAPDVLGEDVAHVGLLLPPAEDVRVEVVGVEMAGQHVEGDRPPEQVAVEAARVGAEAVLVEVEDHGHAVKQQGKSAVVEINELHGGKCLVGWKRVESAYQL